MIGTSLGPYKIIEQLGAGGMGEVYLGEDTRLGRKVAIKVLPEEYASGSRSSWCASTDTSRTRRCAGLWDDRQDA